MKNNLFSRTTFLFILLMIATPLLANTGANRTDEKIDVRALQLTNRLEEIKTMDKENLSSAEKKALRREVRETKKELAAISGGVYLSVGAIILIALLLILLL